MVVRQTRAAIRKKNTGNTWAMADIRSALSLYSLYPGFTVRSKTKYSGLARSANSCFASAKSASPSEISSSASFFFVSNSFAALS